MYIFTVEVFYIKKNANKTLNFCLEFHPAYLTSVQKYLNLIIEGKIFDLKYLNLRVVIFVKAQKCVLK